MKQYSVTNSWSKFEHSKTFIGCGCSTLSKAPSYEGAEPALIERGKGCRVWDVDGNEYIDFANGLGPVSLGYAIPEINTAVVEQLNAGIVYGRPHPLEGEVAEMLCDIVPGAERVRFLKTGGEAIAACIVIARGTTGRPRVVQCGYNGWINRLSHDDGFLPRGLAASAAAGATTSATSDSAAGGVTRGIPDALGRLHTTLPWGKIDEWEKCFAEYGDEIAAAVIACDYAGMELGHDFLPAVRKLTEKHGTLLIFDEIVTGFRLALAGAEEYFGVQPDLAVFAKGMANGMPISAYIGRGDLIDTCRELGISSTFGGEALSLAAVKAVLNFYEEHDVIDYLASASAKLWEKATSIFADHGLQVQFEGVSVCPRITLSGGLEHGKFMKAAFRNGLILYDVPYTNYSHRDGDIQEVWVRFETMAKELAATGG